MKNVKNDEKVSNKFTTTVHFFELPVGSKQASKLSKQSQSSQNEDNDEREYNFFIHYNGKAGGENCFLSSHLV